MPEKVKREDVIKEQREKVRRALRVMAWREINSLLLIYTPITLGLFITLLVALFNPGRELAVVWRGALITGGVAGVGWLISVLLSREMPDIDEEVVEEAEAADVEGDKIDVSDVTGGESTEETGAETEATAEETDEPSPSEPEPEAGNAG